MLLVMSHIQVWNNKIQIRFLKVQWIIQGIGEINPLIRRQKIEIQIVKIILIKWQNSARRAQASSILEISASRKPDGL